MASAVIAHLLPATVALQADRIPPRGTAGRDRGPRRGGQEHAHRPAARRPGGAAVPAPRPSPSRATTPTCTPSWPATPCTAGWATWPTRCTRWPCCSRWTAARPPTTCDGARGRHDLVLVDRYVASNAAYGAARLHQDACGEFVAWVRDLEIDRFGLPVPDRHLLLDVPRAVAARARRAPGAHRARPRARPLRVRRRAAGAHRPRSTASWPRRAGWRRGRCSTARRTSATGTSGYAALADDLIGASSDQGVSRTVGGWWDIACMKSRVLVVDDDPALAEMLTIVLRGEGFDTAVVGDGTRALPAVRELRPDVVLLDLMLPGMNGIDVCRAIRTESGVPIVMLTAKTRHRRHRARPGVGRRRLRRQAVQAQGAGRAHPGPGAADRRRAGRAAGDRRRHHRRAGAPGGARRRADRAHPAGVRPAGGAGPQAAPGVHP